MDGMRSCLIISIFENEETGKANSIFKKLSRSSFSSNYDGKLQSFSALFQLAKLRLVAFMMSREFQILLPSDYTWRLKNYFKLLNKQKEKSLVFHIMPPDDTEETPKWEQMIISQPETKKAKISGDGLPPESSIITSRELDIPWNSLDLAKAAQLLGPNYSQVSFQNEDEMRRIFSLLYDVFRYKNILSDALRQTGFFLKFPEHENKISLTWLLFYDLHMRRFLPRLHSDATISAEIFEKIGLASVEKDLWDFRIKLAASLARSRIKNNALKLNQLLPPHLRDERFVSENNTPVTAWINTFQKSKKEICNSIEKLGLRLQSINETVLTKSDFRFDHLCPKLLLCHPLQRPELAESFLIKTHNIIFQDRAFCLGPALMGKILKDTPLRGTVAQTHVNTPRTTAYLANVLIENERLDKLVAFGAGERLLEYQTYLYELGVTNCEIYAQRFADLHPEAAVLENLVAVLATPPNSYTGVTDPVDLICSRGGDMKMLKDLTQADSGGSSLGYLDEQRETLKYSMSLPQVQIILYETHSLLPEENSEMVKSVTELINDMAREKHEEEHRLMLEREEAEEKLNKPVFIPGKPLSKEEKEREAQEVKEPPPPRLVEVPPCDLFEVVSIADLCTQGGPDGFIEEGCYLAKIQRKEIISLDAKYMIKIAEARGLFGADIIKKKAAPVRAPKKQEKRRTSSAKFKLKRVKLELDRLAAPTQSTIYKAKQECSPFNWSSPSCPRHQSHALETVNKVIQAKKKLIRRWWQEAFGTVLKQIPYNEMTPRSKAGDAEAISPPSTERRTSSSKKCQEESVKRLSKPIVRGSTSPEFFSSEIKSRFWRYATAKSVEDLIRALRKKRRGKRIYKLEDYFFFKEEKYYAPQIKGSFESEAGIPGLEEDKNANFMSKIKKISPAGEDYLNDIQIIKPYVNKDVLRITSYGAVSDKTSSSQITPISKSVITFAEEEKNELIQQCMDNASLIFKKIDEAIEENRKLAEKKIRTMYDRKDDVFNQQRKFKNKSFSPLEALSKIEEISNIIDLKGRQRTDIILSSKYLPGQEVSEQEKKFFKTLQNKLEKLQQSYQHWTKWQEIHSVEKLSTQRRSARR